jgi:hypothetical protein
MPNEGAEKFGKRLFGLSTGWHVDRDGRQETMTVYRERLSKWYLTAPQWDRTIDILVDQHRDGSLPSWHEISDAMKHARAQDSTGSYGWCTFDISGRRTAMRVRADGGLWLPVSGSLPRGASNIAYHPDNPASDDSDVCNQEEARAAFLQGWRESGADPAKCNEMFGLIARRVAA